MCINSCILLLYSNLNNPDVIKSTEDITFIDFTYRNIQLSNDELDMDISARLLRCGDLEEFMLTAIEKLLHLIFFIIYYYLFKCLHPLYETSVSKRTGKFLFNDNSTQQPSFRDPRKR